MTGNKNAWRAPLAGLASVAMIATMGVTALSANAAGENTVKLSNAAYTVDGDGNWGLQFVKDGVLSQSATVANGQSLHDAGYKIVDVRADGYTGTAWSLSKAGAALTTDKVLDYDLKGTSADYELGVTGGEYVNQVAFKNFKAATVYVDISVDGLVQVPGTGVFYTLNGKLVKSGDVVEVADKNQSADEVTDPVITFKNAKGKTVDYKKTVKGFVKDAPEPSNPRAEGWFLDAAEASKVKNLQDAIDLGALVKEGAAGYWVVDFASVEFGASAEVKAVNNPKVSTVKVTFDYGTYKGAPKDVTVKVKADQTVDVNAAIAQKPARDGYLFLGWFLGNTQYNATTDLAGKFNNGADFTLTAKWGKPGKDTAENALKVLPAVTSSFGTVSAADAALFTKASWDEYTEAYKKALVEYQQADWSKVNGSVSEEAAASIIAELNEGRKALRFNTGSVDTTIDGSKRSASGAELVYRLATPDGARHFMTADENEVLARTGKLNGNILHVTQGGWTLESASTFRMVSEGAHASDVVDAGTPSKDYGYEYDTLTKDGTGLLALTKTVTRLYNPANQEHLYTADAHEVLVLTRDHGWSVDSAAANLYTPALYTTDTEVARFYNPATGLHFYTTDKAEINFWTVQHPGIWQKESTGIYAL